MSDPLALLPFALAAARGRIDDFATEQLVAAGTTLLQRAAPLVRALAAKRSAILLPNGPALLVALAASDGRGALLLPPEPTPPVSSQRLRDHAVGAVFTVASFRQCLPLDMPLVLLDDAPRYATVCLADRELHVDLGSHHGLSLAGDTATEGRDEECLLFLTSHAATWTHRTLLQEGRALGDRLRLTPQHESRALVPWSTPEGCLQSFVAPLLAGGTIRTRPVDRG